MEASAATLEAADTPAIAAPHVAAPAETVRFAMSDGRLLGMMVLAGLLGYTAIGAAVYGLVVAF